MGYKQFPSKQTCGEETPWEPLVWGLLIEKPFKWGFHIVPTVSSHLSLVSNEHTPLRNTTYLPGILTLLRFPAWKFRCPPSLAVLLISPAVSERHVCGQRVCRLVGIARFVNNTVLVSFILLLGASWCFHIRTSPNGPQGNQLLS